VARVVARWTRRRRLKVVPDGVVAVVAAYSAECHGTFLAYHSSPHIVLDDDENHDEQQCVFCADEAWLRSRDPRSVPMDQLHAVALGARRAVVRARLPTTPSFHQPFLVVRDDRPVTLAVHDGGATRVLCSWTMVGDVFECAARQRNVEVDEEHGRCPLACMSVRSTRPLRGAVAVSVVLVDKRLLEVKANTGRTHKVTAQLFDEEEREYEAWPQALQVSWAWGCGAHDDSVVGVAVNEEES